MDMSFQLYSARNADLNQTLETLGQLGYKQVEGYGGYSGTGGLGGVYGDLPGLRAALDRNGLTMPSAHMGLDLLETPDRAIEVAQALGIQMVVCPWVAPSDRPTKQEEWTDFGNRLARLAQPFQDAGLTFAYHNHDFEFHPTLPDGRYPMDVMLAAARNISVEVDVAWVVKGQADPVLFFEKYDQRIAAIHVKDIAPPGQNANEDGWADVGQGTLPWRDLLTKARSITGARYFVAEHDNPADVTRFASRSIEAVNSYGV